MMRDERAGIAVLEALERRGVPEGVALRETGTDGYGLVNDLEDTDLAIIVDCADMGREPGAVVVFSPEEVESTIRDRRISLHSVNLLGVVQLAQTLGIRATIRIVGIQPKAIEMGEDLSPEVAAALPRALEAIDREVEKAKKGQPRKTRKDAKKDRKDGTAESR
jgi:hydrogenase maturation protease